MGKLAEKLLIREFENHNTLEKLTRALLERSLGRREEVYGKIIDVLALSLARSQAARFVVDTVYQQLRDEAADAAAKDKAPAPKKQNGPYKKQTGMGAALGTFSKVREKAVAFDRMVEALDAVEVNGKFLGDCTGADLLRAAVELEEQAREATAQSQFYRQLAAIVGKTVTVRSYTDRAGIVGLITSRYKADE